MGGAHSYPKRSIYHPLIGGRLVGRGAGSWLPCPPGKEEGTLGLCQNKCKEGYEWDHMFACKKPDYLKHTEVLPPHVGWCPPGKMDGANLDSDGGPGSMHSAGLCYLTNENIPTGYHRKTLGLLDQYCPQDKEEWRKYDSFNGIVDISFACQRATYTRPLHPKFKPSIKPRKKIPGDPPPTPFCDQITPKHGDQMCVKNRPGKWGPAEVEKAKLEKRTLTESDPTLWKTTDNRDAYYLPCLTGDGWAFDPDFLKCVKDKRDPIDAPGLIPIEYDVIANPLCSMVDPMKDPTKMCIINPPPAPSADAKEGDPDWELTEDGERYYLCEKGYDFDHETSQCIKWAPMATKVIDKPLFGNLTTPKTVADYDTYHKTKLDTKSPQYIPVQYGAPTGTGLVGIVDSGPELPPILFCVDVPQSKAPQLCMDNKQTAEYAVADDFKNFYKLCNSGYRYKDGKCTDDKTPYDPQLIPIEYKMTSNPLCSEATSANKFCREELAPEGYEISQDGENYFLSCETDYTFNNIKNVCVNNLNKTEKATIIIKVKYGTPQA